MLKENKINGVLTQSVLNSKTFNIIFTKISTTIWDFVIFKEKNVKVGFFFKKVLKL